MFAAVVALTPYQADAQAAGSTPQFGASGVQQTVRHTLVGTLGAVTSAAFVSLGRPTRRELANIPALSASAALADRAWLGRATVRGNVAMHLVLEREDGPDGAGGEGGEALDGWQVRTAFGEFVPWSGAPIQMTAALAPGEHEVTIVWLAPSAGSAAPNARLRVERLTP